MGGDEDLLNNKRLEVNARRLLQILNCLVNCSVLL